MQKSVINSLNATCPGLAVSDTKHDSFSQTLKWWNTSKVFLSGDFSQFLDTGIREFKFIGCTWITSLSFSIILIICHTTLRTLSFLNFKTN
jgi:hypothetical protein